MKNPKTQFEIISISRRNLMDDYGWCLDNLPLKDGYGLVYNVSQIFIITASQKIVDKVNAHFGSGLSFWNPVTLLWYVK